MATKGSNISYLRGPGRWQRTPLRIEAAFLPRDLEELKVLRVRILMTGASEAVANGLIGWLVAKDGGQHGGHSTSARYRRILEQIAEEDGVRSAAA